MKQNMEIVIHKQVLELNFPPILTQDNSAFSKIAKNWCTLLYMAKLGQLDLGQRASVIDFEMVSTDGSVALLAVCVALSFALSC